MLSPTCSARRGQPDVVSPTADQTGGPIRRAARSDGRPDQTGRPPAAPAAADPSLDPLAGRDWAHCPSLDPLAGRHWAHCPSLNPLAGRHWAHCPCVHHPGAGSDGHTAGRRPRPSAAPVGRERRRGPVARPPRLDAIGLTARVFTTPARDQTGRPPAAPVGRRRRPRPQTQTAPADSGRRRQSKRAAS